MSSPSWIVPVRCAPRPAFSRASSYHRFHKPQNSIRSVAKRSSKQRKPGAAVRDPLRPPYSHTTPVVVAVVHVLAGRMAAVHRRDAVGLGLGARNAAVVVVLARGRGVSPTHRPSRRRLCPVLTCNSRGPWASLRLGQAPVPSVTYNCRSRNHLRLTERAFVSALQLARVLAGVPGCWRRRGSGRRG